MKKKRNIKDDSDKVVDALKESENKFRAVFDGAGDGILAADSKTKKFVFANPKFCEITGYPLKELLKLGVADIHPKKELPYVIDQFTKQLQGKITLARDIPVLRKDKKIIYCDVNSKPRKIGGQELLLGFFRDNTEQKKAEEALKKSKERLKFLVSSSPAVIYTSKIYGDYGATFISENVNEQTGYKPEDFIKDSNFWVDHIHPDDKKRVLDDLKQIFKRSQYTHEYRFKYKDGKYHWMKDESKFTKDEKGKPKEIIGYWVDITDRKKAEQEKAGHVTKLQEQKDSLEELNFKLKEQMDMLERFKEATSDHVLGMKKVEEENVRLKKEIRRLKKK